MAADKRIVIPEVYRKFLESGREREFDDGCLYDETEIQERYITCGFAEYAPEFVPIGGDGGGRQLVMRADRGEKSVGIVEDGSIGSLDPQNWQDFERWYESGHSFTDFDDEQKPDLSRPVRVMLKKTPQHARNSCSAESVLSRSAAVGSGEDREKCALSADGQAHRGAGVKGDRGQRSRRVGRGDF